MSGKSKFQISRSLDERIKRIIGGTNEYDTEFGQVPSAYILGFHYGNVTNCVGLTTNYQLHHAVFPVVGLVFFKSSPSDEDVISSLKVIKEFSSSPNGLGSFKSDKNEHLFLIYNVDKNNEIEKRIFNFTKGSFVRRRRLRLNILNDPYCPRQVHRGSEDLFAMDDGDSLEGADDDNIEHLIFFIHGVGGVCDVRFRSCVEVVADFKKLANNLLAQNSNPSSGASTPASESSSLSQNLKKGFFRKKSSDSGTSRTDSEISAENIPSPLPSRVRARRVECLPISWHSCTRRQTGMNDQLGLTALSSVHKLRHFLNKVVMDAMLYSSGPAYSQTIINNVGDEINRLYTLFMEKHPNFSGSISLAGHSLGSVIVFDLLANQQKEYDQSSSTRTFTQNAANDSKHSTHFEDVRRQCGQVGHHHYDFSDELSQPRGSCMDYKNLDDLLRDMNLTQYADMFHKEHIDLSTLLLLTDFDMKELNLPFGVRRRLGTYINFKKVAKMHATNTQMPKQEQSPTDSENNNKINDNHTSEMASNENNNNYIGGNLFESSNTGQYLIKYPQLKFKPRCFFAFGSPMPMFLNVRGVQDISKDYKLPTCDRMLNIFHPYDPLAYRLEPLIDPRFKNVEPVQIPHHRGGKRIHVQLREGFARVGHDIKHRLLGSLRNTWTSFTRFNAPTGPPEPPPAVVTVTADNYSPGIESSLGGAEHSRRRLTKSSSSSVDVEVESFEGSLGLSMKQQKRHLKRQLSVKSQTDVNVTSLDSIIEGNVRHNKEFDAEAILDSFSMKVDDELEQSLPSKTNITNTRKESIKEKEPIDGQSKTAGANGTGNDQKDGLAGATDGKFDATKIGQLNGGRRLDYVLQEKPIELFNEYIFAFTSHANYWQNEDSALILLNEIYQSEGVHLFEGFE